MTPMPSERDKAKQFSLRSLFLVTLVVCVVFAVVRLANETAYVALLFPGLGALLGYLKTKSFRGFELGIALGMIVVFAIMMVGYLLGF